MSQKVSIIILGTIFLVGLTHSKSLSNGVENQQLIQTPSQSNVDLLSILKLLNILHILQQSDDSSTGQQNQFQEEMLNAHNSYRNRHCAPPLQLNDDLSHSAQDHAENLASMRKMFHGDTSDVGENLYMLENSAPIDYVNGTEVTTAWYNENKDYDFNTDYQSTALHFSQVVWKSSVNLGVGIAFTSDRLQAYVVAHYSPQGNNIGDFKNNVLPAQC